MVYFRSKIFAAVVLVALAASAGCGDSAPSALIAPPLPNTPARVAVTLPLHALAVGRETRASATVYDAAGNQLQATGLSWSSSASNVATVNANGVVIAVGPGNTRISASLGNVTGSDSLVVSSAAPPTTPSRVATVTVTLGVTSLQVGQITQASATVRDSSGAIVTGQAIVWSVDGASAVATVSSAGLVTAALAGTAVIRATIGTVTGTAVLTVSTSPTVPPPTGNSAVPLLVTRLTAGTGPVLVSNAVPLKPGMLFGAGLGNVALWINGVEVPIAVAATAGTHADGSLRSVVVQTTYDVPAAGVAATLQLGAARTKSSSAAAIPSVPVAVALPTDPTYLMATGLTGRTIAVTQSVALGGVWGQYESDFVTWADKHWATYGPDWQQNYYDRAQIYYAWWVRTGNPEYWRRATLTAVDYRTKYLEPNNYGASHHWAQLEGLAEHYWLTGDAQSQKAVGRTADVLGSYYRNDQLGNINHIDMESRIQAKSLQAFLLAWEVQANGGPNYTAASWATHLPQMLTQILKAQNANGAFYWNGYCGASINYMNGMLNDVMIRYYERFQADSRIPASVKANADWLWANQWRLDQSFNYQSVYCARPGDTGGPSATPDLNGVYVTTYSWLYQQTGQASYRITADVIFANGVKNAFLSGQKQFNQEYMASYKYLWYRQ